MFFGVRFRKQQDESANAHPDLRTVALQPSSTERGIKPIETILAQPLAPVVRRMRPGPTHFGVPLPGFDIEPYVDDLVRAEMREADGYPAGAVRVLRELNNQLLNRNIQLAALAAIVATLTFGIAVLPALEHVAWLRLLLVGLGSLNAAALWNLLQAWAIHVLPGDVQYTVEHVEFLARLYVRRCMTYNMARAIIAYSTLIVILAFLVKLFV